MTTPLSAIQAKEKIRSFDENADSYAPRASESMNMQSSTTTDVARMEKAAAAAARASFVKLPDASLTIDSVQKSWIAQVFGCVFTRVLRKDDDQITKLLKQWIFTMAIVFTALAGYMMYANLKNMDEGDFGEGYTVPFWVMWWTSALILWSGVAMTFLQVTRSFPKSALHVTLFWLGGAVIVPLDMQATLYMEEPFWAMFVIALDLALVFGASPYVRRVLVAIAVIWLFLVQLHLHIRLFVDPLNPTLHEKTPARCNCAQPPCPFTPGGSTMVYLGQLCVFLFDYNVTSGFAEAVAAEQRQMTVSIMTAEDIAMCLSAFDLSAAEELLRSDAADEQLPPRLSAAFNSILANLRVYRPYLPQSCFPQGKAPNTPRNAHAADVKSPNSRHSDGGDGSESDHSSNSDACPSMFSGASRGRAQSSQSEASLRLGLRQGLGRAALPQITKITLVQTNLHDTTSWCHDTSVVGKVFREMVSLAVSAFTERSRGVMDYFVGDHILVSFNASRSAARHATLAVAASKAFLTTVRVSCGKSGNCAVGTGQAVCGDLGSDTLRRFSVLGSLPVHVAGLERVGRIAGMAILCNDNCAMDAATDHELQCLPRLVQFTPCRISALVDRRSWGRRDSMPVVPQGMRNLSDPEMMVMTPGSTPTTPVQPSGGRAVADIAESPLDNTASAVSVFDDFTTPVATLWAVYEVHIPALPEDTVELAAPTAKASGSAGEEWMYELASSAPQQWADYNKTMKQFLHNGDTGAAVRAIAGRPKAALLEHILETLPSRLPIEHRV